MNRFKSMLAAASVAATLGPFQVLAAEPPVTAAQIAAARTSADHEAIAAAYDEEATRLEALAKEHEAMAKSYRAKPAGQKGGDSAAMSAHCLRLQKNYSDAAKEARAMAKEHRSMGGSM